MNNDPSRTPMQMMLHHSSGRHNFNFVQPENNFLSVGSLQQTPPVSTEFTQRQTNQAIKAATESNSKMTNNKKEIEHINVTCDGCSKSLIISDRYKCMFCPNIDFCQDCKSLTIGQHDSSLYTSSIHLYNVSEFKHWNTHCAYCSALPIIGIRYQCTTCGINLCEKCEFLCLHDVSHKRLKMIYPE